MLINKGKRRIRGFTIVELVFTILIFSILMLSIIKITVDSTKVFKRGMVQSEMKDQLRRTMDAIATDVRQAQVLAGSTEWTSPPQGNDKVTPVTRLTFYRYLYNSGDPDSPNTGLIEYQLTPDPDPDAGLNMYILTRTETISGTIRYNVMAENLYVEPGNPANGSYFRWAPNEIDTGKVVNDAVLVRFVMKQYHGQKMETLDLVTRVALRSLNTSESTPPLHPTQYNVFMDSPSSLLDPRE